MYVPFDFIYSGGFGKQIASQKTKLKTRNKGKINFCKAILSVLTASPSKVHKNIRSKNYKAFLQSSLSEKVCLTNLFSAIK